MLPSMYSGISGIAANQRKLDVVGNNIANASTTAYKSQSMRFQDMISQSTAQATGPSVNVGGTNPKQIGLGVQIAGISSNMTTGNMQPTSRKLDFAIDGSGYFLVGKGPAIFEDEGISIEENKIGGTEGDTKGLDIMYTRDGSFTLDKDGNLLTSDGERVLGYSFGSIALSDDEGGAVKKGKLNFVDSNEEMPDAEGLKTIVIPDTIEVNGQEKRIQGFSVEKDGVIKASVEGGGVSIIGQIAMASFKNDAGLSKLGKNLYRNTANSGEPVLRCSAKIKPEDEGYNGGAYGDVIQGSLEMSNVDLAEQFTEMIIASRAFQANGKIISTGDEILQDLVNLKR